jgi:hypothetical protein
LKPAVNSNVRRTQPDAVDVRHGKRLVSHSPHVRDFTFADDPSRAVDSSLFLNVTAGGEPSAIQFAIYPVAIACTFAVVKKNWNARVPS